MIASTPGPAIELESGSYEQPSADASGSHEQPPADAPSPTNSTVGDLTEMEEEGQDDGLRHFDIQPTLHPSTQIHCTDLATISTQYSLLSDEQKYQILTAKPCQLSEYPLNKQKRRFQSKWIRSTPGYAIQSQRMVYIVLRVICLAKFVSILNLSLYHFEIGKMLQVISWSTA